MARQRRERGTSMVEFAILAPFLLVVLFGLIDFSRASSAASTVADAARQGARQAAAVAQSSDSPFSTPNGSACSGSVFTKDQVGTGCLTDQAILTTVTNVLGSSASSVVLKANTTAANCGQGANTPPSAGVAFVCIAPGESSSGAPDSTHNTCTKVSLGSTSAYPFGNVGDRKTEWNSGSGSVLKGCFLVQVTVHLAFVPWTPLVGPLMGNRLDLISSTSTIAEY